MTHKQLKNIFAAALYIKQKERNFEKTNTGVTQQQQLARVLYLNRKTSRARRERIVNKGGFMASRTPSTQRIQFFRVTFSLVLHFGLLVLFVSLAGF